MSDAGPLRATSWFRESVSPGLYRQQLELVHRMETLCEQGIVDELAVRRWPRRVFEPAAWAYSDVESTLHAIRSFGDEPFVDKLNGIVRVDEITSGGDRVAVTHLPVNELLIYEGDTLRFVAPATIGSRHVSVQDAIKQMERTGSLDSLVSQPSLGESVREAGGGLG